MRRVLPIAAALAIALLALSLDWRPGRSDAAPEVVRRLVARGPLLAGAARVDLTPGFPVPLAGYPGSSRSHHAGVAEPPQVRALALRVEGRTVVLASAELLLVPAPLRAKVRAGLGDEVDELFLAATHTHSSIGGFWDHRLAQWVGLGRFDPRIEVHLAARIEEAARAAVRDLAPARLGAARIEASNYSARRGGPGEVDPGLTAVSVTGEEGRPLARLIVYAAHPTIVPRENRALSGDWPGHLLAALEEDGTGPALFLQGALGNVTWGKRAGEMPPEERALRFGRALAAEARGALAAAGEGESEVPLELARVRVSLPPADARGAVGWPFTALASNVLHWLAGADHTEVSWLRLGPLRFAMLPGEPVSELGLAWRRQLGGATVVSLVDDYVGYVETPEAVEAGRGEAHRTYFGPSLAPLLLDGLVTARAAAESPPP